MRSIALFVIRYRNMKEAFHKICQDFEMKLVEFEGLYLPKVLIFNSKTTPSNAPNINYLKEDGFYGAI